MYRCIHKEKHALQHALEHDATHVWTLAGALLSGSVPANGIIELSELGQPLT
jgi:hypothetical protein